MDIINQIQERLALSFAQHASLRYWGKIILEQLRSRTEQSVQLTQLTLKANDHKSEELIFAKAQSGLNVLGFSPSLLQTFIIPKSAETWDDYDRSIANSKLNESLMVHRVKYLFQKTDVTLAEDLIELEWTIRVQQESFKAVLYTSLNELKQFLARHPDPKSKNLDALVDVPLTVRVELGSIKRKVKEILEFNTGTLIELDQNVNQAVKLVVNNTTIATGTVIEVKGHFGVRIEQIDDKAQFIKE